MVRKDGDTMKECMKTNNPTEFRDSKNDAEARFNKAMDAYEESQGIIHGISFAPGPDVTAESQVQVTAKEENGVVWHTARVVNTTYSVNLRSEPNLDSAVMTHIHPDSEFFMSATRNPDWYKVRLKDGTEGFASSKFVTRVMPNEHT